ncbi:CatB-related O-acetyltransferase [Kluyvera huaxiensis]|uniref:CatB-related O-acetyltransferase n=1 Tax=Kluyvera sp. 142053 TaxID=3160979 RepID=UPI0032E04B17
MSEHSVIAKSSSISPTTKVEHPIHCGPSSQIHAECNVGCYLFLNIGSIIYPHVTIGRFCSIARGCEIGVANHPTTFLSSHSFQYHSAQFPNDPIYKNNIKRVSWRGHPPTSIGNDVWIGAQSIIKAGIKIGDGAVIAANSVVVKDVPPYSIVGGTPAKQIRMRFSEEQIRKLLKLEWWALPLKDIGSLPFDNIDECIKALEDIRES